MDFLIQYISRILTWFVDFFVYCVEWVCETVLGGLITLLQAIPVPQWLTDAPSVLSNLPPGVVYMCNLVQLPAGLVILLSAWGLRFLIRRIPIIG
jgi:hypothetical protein